MSTPEVPVALLLWEDITGYILDRTAQFPKAVRFTFAARIDGIALDVLERLVEARFASGARKQQALEAADLLLARLRVLVRLSHARKYLSSGAYEHVSVQLDEVGRMVGGWRAAERAKAERR
jgi:hypothetical protein